MRFHKLLIAAICLSATRAQAQSVTVLTNPNNARIQQISDAGVWQLLGTGSAKVKMRKEIANRIYLILEGYDTIPVDLDITKKYPKEGVVFTLDRRVVNVTALPYDAKIYENGAERASRLYRVKVPKGVPTTIEVRKPGFKPETKTYRWDAITDVLPVDDRFELKDRMVRVFSVPEGATFKVDGNPISSGKEADVIIPVDQCVTVTGELLGFTPQTWRTCFRGSQIPPEEKAMEFTEHVVHIVTNPATADIILNSSQRVASGTYDLPVPVNTCVTVNFQAQSYVSDERQFCDKGGVKPPVRETVDLTFDDAYTASAKTDQANVDVTIEVGAAKSADMAWRTISQIILSKFDVLEITDKETGYMRTAWEFSKFDRSLVRTRVIVKLGDTAPLKYIVKVASEHSKKPGELDIKNDQNFYEWDRLMNKYKDIVSELQARLR